MEQQDSALALAGKRRQFLKWAAVAPTGAMAAASAVLAADADTGPAAVEDLSAEFSALAARSSAAIARIESFRLTPQDLPWAQSLGGIKAGQSVSIFLSGYWWFVKEAGSWLDPGFVFYARVAGASETSPVHNAMANTSTLTATADGKVEIARSVGELASAAGDMAVPPEYYHSGEGEIRGVAIVWDEDPRAGLHKLSAVGDVGGAITAEIQRLRLAELSPKGWHNLFQFGECGVFSETPSGGIACDTHKNVAIMTKGVSGVELKPGLKLEWRWQVDELPSLAAENELLFHDYLAIGVGFDDGQDITYPWSKTLPIGTSFRCPIPGWDKVESHVVQRQGDELLGEMLDESADIYVDYKRMVGGEATKVTSVWLVGVSVFKRGHGRCQYERIALGQEGQQTNIL